MSDLKDDVLEQRLRAACREVIPLLAQAERFDSADAQPMTFTGLDDNVVKLDAVLPRPSQSGATRLVAAAAAALLVFGGLALLQRDQPSGSSADSSDAAGTGTGYIEQTPSAFRDLVATVLPAGFVAMYNQRDPLEVVAYNSDGVRLSVYVDIGNAEASAKDIPLDRGSALSPDGDRIKAEVLYNTYSPDLSSVGSVTSGRAAIPAIVAAVAEKFTGTVRTTILNSQYPQIDSEQLRAAISADLSPIVGPLVGDRVRGAGDFALMYSNNATYVTVNAVRTDRSLRDSISSPGAGALTGVRWVNGWQMIVVSNAADGHTALGEAVMQQILTTIGPLLTAWQPARTSQAGCTTHTVALGDSSVNVAERYGVTLDELKRINPDLEASFSPGAVIQIPCASPADLPTSPRPADAYRADGNSKPDWFFEASNGIVRSSQRLTYTVSGGMNNQLDQGAIRITASTFEGTLVRDSVILLSPCDGPTSLVNDLTAPLERVPFTCSNDTQVFTIDLYSGQSQVATEMSSIDAPSGAATSTTSTTAT